MRFDSAISLKSFSRPFLCGKNPKKRNSEDGSPETERAAVRALAPGIGMIETSGRFARTEDINAEPGSEIVGVPASETNATFFPADRRLRTWAILAFSVRAFILVSRVFMLYRAVSRDVTRVSSHRIVSTEDNVEIARNVMSSRFPIGVATM